MSKYRTFFGICAACLSSIGTARADPYAFTLSGDVDVFSAQTVYSVPIDPRAARLTVRWTFDSAAAILDPSGQQYDVLSTIATVLVDGDSYVARVPVTDLQIRGSDAHFQHKGFSFFGLEGNVFTSFDMNAPFAARPVTLIGDGGVQVVTGPSGAYKMLYFTAAAPLTLSYGPDAAALPELSTWAMAIAGFGLIGAGLRRRSRPAGRPVPSATAAG